MPPAIILVRPREEGNVGMVARAMANMGLERLILVEPAPAIGGVARGFGVGGWRVLERCRREPSFEAAIAPFRRLVGTTSARQRREPRILTPRTLPEVLAADPPETETALVFGPEDNGLTRRQLDSCHPVVAVPCARDHPTLNLAQAVLVVAYELYLAAPPSGARSDGRGEASAAGGTPAPATAAELAALLDQSGRTLERIGYDQDRIRTRLVNDLRRLLIRSGATTRELRVLRRLLNRALRALDRAANNAAGSGGRE